MHHRVALPVRGTLRSCKNAETWGTHEVNRGLGKTLHLEEINPWSTGWWLSSFPFIRFFHTLIRSPLSLLFSRPVSPSSLCLSSQTTQQTLSLCWNGPSKIIPSNLLQQAGTSSQLDLVAQSPILALPLNTARDGISVISLGNLFQSLIIIIIKNISVHIIWM